MGSENTITVIVPAFNEEGRLEPTVREVLAAVRAESQDYEIIVIDDASTDGTGAEADRAAQGCEKVRVVHNDRNMGLGWNYKAGVRLARMHYVTWVGGKHDIEADQLREILSRRGQADMVIPYHTNPEERPRRRQLISRAYIGLLNGLFGYRLHHYNESVLLATERVRSLVVRTDSYAFQAEILIKALRSGYTYVEVPIRNRYVPGAPTRAFRLKNVVGVTKFLLWTLWDIYGGRRCRRA